MLSIIQNVLVAIIEMCWSIMKEIILVNGIPASGKSSVVRVISEHFGFPVLSLDDIKEPFMLQFTDIIDRPFNRRLGYAAYEAMFKVVNASPDNTVFVLDAWFGFREKDILVNYLGMCGISSPAEIWNKISPSLVAKRYKERCGLRIKGHPGEEYIPELMALAKKAGPMQVGETFIVDQDAGVNTTELLCWVKNHIHL